MVVDSLEPLHAALFVHLRACDVPERLLDELHVALEAVAGKMPTDTELFEIYQYASVGALRVCISMLSGPVCQLVVRSTTTVRELKEAVETAIGVPASEQRFMRDGTPMEEAKTLAAHSITPLSRNLHLYRQRHMRVYAIGGRTETAGALDFCEALDLQDGETWKPLPTMLTCRAHASAIAVDGRVFVAGGDDGLGETLDSAEVFDPMAGSWQPLPPMGTPRARLALVALRSGSVCAIGGTNGLHSLSSAEAYDLETGAWSVVPAMTCQRSALAAVAFDGLVYVAGGRDGRRVLTSAEAFDPDVMTWRALPSMSEARHSLALAPLNGRIYALGGYDGVRSLPTVEEFVPGADVWRSHAPMTSRRSAFGAVNVGKSLLVVGGTSRRVALRTAEELHEPDGTWRELSQMSVPRLGLALVAM
mmetsp:Transcript_9016/g.23531  ORF Transcript_9016/g.23531 Transcript_9016/m.23531 type:complete len:419 (-) Transcript_9016:89-1345(-)